MSRFEQNEQNNNNLCTNRQEQIERIAKLLHRPIINIELKTPKEMRLELAEHLVDSGVGDKDRFHAYVWKQPRTTQMVIEPIDYKEEECT